MPDESNPYPPPPAERLASECVAALEHAGIPMRTLLGTDLGPLAVSTLVGVLATYEYNGLLLFGVGLNNLSAVIPAADAPSSLPGVQSQR